MSRSPSPLESLLVRVTGEISSQTLKLDPASYPRLEALAGTRIRFDVLPPRVPGLASKNTEPRTVLLEVLPDALQLQLGSDEQAHAVVRGALPDIARALLAPSAATGKPAATSAAQIAGDEAALQAVAGLFRDLQPDLAEPLARVIGRDAADNLVGAAEAGVAFLRSAAESLAGGARKEAGQAWVTDQAQSSLMDRLDDLKLRVDRLDARTRIAEGRAAPSRPSGQ
jgi:ubiquinone biosynthesis protein UbiJ